MFCIDSCCHVADLRVVMTNLHYDLDSMVTTDVESRWVCTKAWYLSPVGDNPRWPITYSVTVKAWNTPVGTRGNLPFKFAPGSQEFGMNQGQFQINQGQYQMIPDHKKVRTQRDLFCLVLWKQVMIIISWRKVHSKFKNFCALLYLCDVSPRAHFDSILLRPVVDF